ncbi:FdhD protein [Stella humosa]|uniref:Sulfur carrier protein FdhD n=1 Tax=Stella humosa TaxID=94 RepID=A0A3N1MJ26_9PROT|nr:formate dehydrogenase accessory sulfurtransferase FdhD [Stella humosa]ROQ03339.1 FdhD protein [Stella humosa]BBK29626.1 sulfurtransferase FdhD [Stella humosa]
MTDSARHLPDPDIGPASPGGASLVDASHVRSVGPAGWRALPVAEAVAAEQAVALSYGEETHVVMMATPADLEDLAIGFTLAEGIVGDIGEISGVLVADLDVGMRLAIGIPPARAARLGERARNLPGRSGCGLCGIASIEAALRHLPPVPAGRPVRVAAVMAAVAALPAQQTLNRATGAVHAAAFADREGRLLAVREDVGRHNALDKLIGAAARAGLDPADGFLVLTSRCSMEMVQKAATAGFPMLVAISAPTALAIALADGCGLTLAAFARPDGFNLYAHPGRVIVPPAGVEGIP